MFRFRMQPTPTATAPVRMKMKISMEPPAKEPPAKKPAKEHKPTVTFQDEMDCLQQKQTQSYGEEGFQGNLGSLVGCLLQNTQPP